jgi:D-proline reductase (dithiol) PrdB
MQGSPTVLITVFPNESRQAGPPRAIHPKGFKPGNALGGPFQDALQRKVLLAALARWEAREEPGNIWERDFPEYDNGGWTYTAEEE